MVIIGFKVFKQSLTPEGSSPVLDHQSLDPLEFLAVVSHQHRTKGQGVSGDERVERADAAAFGFQAGADQAVVVDAIGALERKSPKRCKDFSQGGFLSFLISSVLKSEFKFREGDGG